MINMTLQFKIINCEVSILFWSKKEQPKTKVHLPTFTTKTKSLPLTNSIRGIIQAVGIFSFLGVFG